RIRHTRSKRDCSSDVCSSDLTGVKVTLLYTVFEDYPVIARSARVENTGDSPVNLERVYSACLDLPTMGWDMVHLYGRWAKENTTDRKSTRLNSSHVSISYAVF